MKRHFAAAAAAVLVLGTSYPVFSAPKHLYTDAGSGFSVQAVKPVIEYASRHSYGFQEEKSATDSFVSLTAIPADIVEKKTGATFTTKEFMKHFTDAKNDKSGGKSGYVLFRPETYSYPAQPDAETDDALFQVFDRESLADGTFSGETRTVGKQNYYVISMQYPGAFDKEKDIDKKASDIKLYLTSANDILYLAQSLCSAETEAAKAENAAGESKNAGRPLKKEYEEKGVSMETAGNALRNPQALQKALLPLTDSSLNDPEFRKALQKERETFLKGLKFFKPYKTKTVFGIPDTVLKQTLPLPADWIYVKGTPEIKEQEGLKLNVALAAPYTMVTRAVAAITAAPGNREPKPEEIYDLYDEGLILASYSFQKGKKNKEITDFAEELFRIPQPEMQKVLDGLLPELLKNEALKKYAVLDNTKAAVTNDGQTITFTFDSHVNVLSRFDFLTRATLAGTRENGLFGLYIVKGARPKTNSVMNLTNSVKLLPEKSR